MIRNLAPCAMILMLPASFAAQQTPIVASPPTAPPARVAQLLPGQFQADDHILQDGTPVKLQLTRALSSADAKPGQEIYFEVADDIDVDGVTVLRKGASAVGVVTEAEAKKRRGRAGKLSFRLTHVRLADDEKASLRSVNDTRGASHTAGMAALMVAMPLAAAPFFLLMKGEDSSIPMGTRITAFIDGDIHLDLARFERAPQNAASVSLVIESTPAGADIEIDDAPAGKTPSAISVVAGSHRISVRKEGFTDWKKTLSVTGSSLHVNAVLEQGRAQ